MIQVLPDVICIHISLHAVQFLQLCDVDGIGFLFTSSHASNLTSFICCTNGNGRLLGRPCSCGICGLFIGSSRIIPGDTSCSRCFGPAADGYATFFADFCVMADGDDIRNGRFIVCCIRRSQDEIVLGIRQFVVIAKDDVGLVRISAVTSYGVMSTNDVVVLAVGQGGIEAFYIVQLRRFVFIICITAASNRVANAVDLGHISIVNIVAAAHDHDLTTAGWYSLLQILSYSCCIFLREILLHLAQIEFRGINGAIRIGDCIACTIDDGGIRVSRRIGLTDNAVSYTAMLFRDICVLVNVECTIGQSRCTLQTCSNNAGIGTGYRRSNAICMRVEASSNTAHTLGTVIVFIAVTINLRQYRFIDRIVFDVMGLIVQCTRISCNLCIEGAQILACRVVGLNIIRCSSWLIIVIERLARYQLVGSRCIRSLVGCTCSERTCTKSLAPGVFAAVLGRCCSIACVFDRFVVLICLINFDIVTHTRSFLQLFHDDDIVIINTIGNFDKTVVGSCLMRIFCNRWVFGIIIKSIIRIS